MIRALPEEYALCDRFIAYLLKRNKRVEEDFTDHLFNSIEKRLARTLLLLAGYGKQNKPEKIVPTVSQEMLAEMIGTTRTRVNLFINKFRKLGFIEYATRRPDPQINKSLLAVLLQA